MVLADPSSAGRWVTGEPFLVTDEGVVGFEAGSEHFAVVRGGPDGVDAVALLDEVALPPGCEVALAPLWIGTGPAEEAVVTFLDRWGRRLGARTGAHAPKGWCSWYQYFHRVSPDAIRASLATLAARGFEVVQVDDGYQAEVGDWLEPRDGWQGELEKLAEEIGQAGMTAGIWTAPFLVGEQSRVAREHPEWLLRSRDGAPVPAMHNPIAWGGWAYALDTTRADVLEHLRRTFSRLVELGYRYHKIDFCYAGGLEGVRADGRMTRASALRAGLEAVREGIGEESFLLGCGCPFGPAIGVVDAMRVSPDVAPYWAPKEWQPGFSEHPPAARNAITASVLRAAMHRRLWINDPDCLLVRPFDTELDEAERQVLAATVAGTGGFTVVSDDVSRYGAEEWSLVDRVARSASCSTVEPVMLFGEPVVVQSGNLELAISWETGSDSGRWSTSDRDVLLGGASASGAWAALSERPAHE